MQKSQIQEVALPCMSNVIACPSFAL